MKTLLSARTFGLAVLLAGTIASAQVRPYDPYYRDDPYSRNGGYRNDGYGRNGGWGRGDRDIFTRVQRDLDRAAQGNNYRSGRERDRFENARRHLYEFSSRLDSGRFDKDKLDEAIEDIQNVVNNNSLQGRDRSVLQSDLARLREFRRTRGASGGYGGSGYGGGYGGYRDPYYRP